MEQPALIPASLGERLRAAREVRRQSIGDAARALKCAPARVEAIEADERAGLAPVYYRGFVRSYASWLGLDAAELLAELPEQPGQEPGVKPAFEVARPVPPSDRWLRAASYVLASLLVGTLAWQMIHEAVRLADLGDAPVAGPSSAAGEVAREAHVNASLAPPETALTPPPRNRAGAAGAGAWAAADAAMATPCAGPLAPGEHCLELSASADSWVEITGGDGARIEQDILRGGDRRQYRGLAPFVVSIGRSSAVELSLDGQAVALSPGPDDVARLRLDPKPGAEDDPGTP
jgi:cytoskeleton protein RodZ